MFKNVLVGVEGGPHGRDAIALGKRLCEPGGKLTLVHVFSGSTRPIDAVTPGMVEEDRGRAHKLLDDERTATSSDADLLAVDAMTAGEGLHLAAEQLEADLLVVGSCRRGPFKRVLLGDDTRASLNGAPCAVAVAPAGYNEQAAPLRIDRSRLRRLARERRGARGGQGAGRADPCCRSGHCRSSRSPTTNTWA